MRFLSLNIASTSLLIVGLIFDVEMQVQIKQNNLLIRSIKNKSSVQYSMKTRCASLVFSLGSFSTELIIHLTIKPFQ